MDPTVTLKRAGNWLEVRADGTKVLDVFLDDPLLRAGITIPLDLARTLRLIDIVLAGRA